MRVLDSEYHYDLLDETTLVPRPDREWTWANIKDDYFSLRSIETSKAFMGKSYWGVNHKSRHLTVVSDFLQQNNN